jgi:hypothetical protein
MQPQARRSHAASTSLTSSINQPLEQGPVKAAFRLTRCSARHPGCRLDFDDDLPPLDVPALVARVAALSQQLQRTLATARQGQLLRTGLQVRGRAAGAVHRRNLSPNCTSGLRHWQSPSPSCRPMAACACACPPVEGPCFLGATAAAQPRPAHDTCSRCALVCHAALRCARWRWWAAPTWASPASSTR